MINYGVHRTSTHAKRARFGHLLSELFRLVMRPGSAWSAESCYLDARRLRARRSEDIDCEM